MRLLKIAVVSSLFVTAIVAWNCPCVHRPDDCPPGMIPERMPRVCIELGCEPFPEGGTYICKD
ncbi:hypothetical protein GQ42DRAFT_161773 [Ramicandelaber brevisporus]|nr:hypothetical protein GQ42DRAFT_161773 [Ramicandelaber brevisporus]